MDWWCNIVSVILLLHSCISHTLTSYHSLMGTESTTAQVTPAEFTRSMMDLAQEKGAKLTIASAEFLEFEADDVTPKCVRAVDEKGQTIEIPVTDIVLAAGPWTARLASKLLGTRAGAALDIEPRFVTPFSAFRSLLTAIMTPPIAGAQPLSFFDPPSLLPRMPSSPNSRCFQANRSLLNSTPAQMVRYICVETTRIPCVHVHFRHEQQTLRRRRTR